MPDETYLFLEHFMPTRWRAFANRPALVSWCERSPENCFDCVEDLTWMIKTRKVTITKEFMCAVPASLKQRVIEAICLRAVESTNAGNRDQSDKAAIEEQIEDAKRRNNYVQD